MKLTPTLRRGFTLIVLLIVIVIIGILAVGLVPKVIDAPKKARDTVRKKDLDSMKVALESYMADNAGYPNCNGNSFSRLTDSPLPACLSGLNAYFQGSKVPNGPDGKSVYYYWGSKSLGCYVLSTSLESPSGGNAKVDIMANQIIAANSCDPSKSVAIAAGSGSFYHIGGGSY